MKFEWLPNEIILDIFEYVDGINLLRGFSELNSRLNKLLNIFFQSYHLDFRSISKNTFNIICQKYLPLILNKTISIHLSDDDETPNLPEIFLSYHFQFLHLQSLSLYSIRSIEILNQIILQCHHIKQLKIIQCFFNNEENDLFNNIWNLSKLIDCQIDDMLSKGICFSKLSNVSYSIKYLSIKNITCDFRSLSYVFQHTPCLRRLSTTIKCTEKNEKLPIIVPHLSKLTLSFHGSLSMMINLFTQIINLQYLTLRTSYLLLDGNEWENLLINYLPNLKVFQFKMDFQFPENTNLEDQVDELLNTFQTDYWIKKHQWFVRCDWNPSNPFNQAILYTLPYAFNDFNFLNEFHSKSTCYNEKDYWSYNHVNILQHESNLSNNFIYLPIRFLNISHLEIILPFNEKFLSNILSLDHLYSLDVTLLPGDSVYYQLQTLLNLASNLHLLRFSHLSDFEMMLFKIFNKSIRRLDFFTKESMLYSWYFNKEQCITLANSSLGQQCQTLVIDVKNRTNIIDLINHMPNLQSLTFQCKDDKWNNKVSSIINDELLQWLNEHLPFTCSIFRHKDQTSIIQIWIR